VDGRGEPFEPRARDSGQALTAIERQGDPVAVVRHAAYVDGAAITREIGPSMLVALDNEPIDAGWVTKEAACADVTDTAAVPACS
jgi:hypothetical protein